MDILYTTILQFLNDLIPSAINQNYLQLNELLAYFITIGLAYALLLNPLVRMFRRITGGKN